MAQQILLRGAKQLLTLRGPSGARRGSALREIGVIEDGSVLIRDGLISAVGTSRRIENLKEARNAFEIPVNGKVVMPAFVDAGINLGAQLHPTELPESGKRHKTTEFVDRTVSLLQSCSRHGTLTAELKAEVDVHDSRANLPVFRQLAKIGSNPVRTVRTCRIGRMLGDDQSIGTGFIEALSALWRGKLVRYVEIEPDLESTSSNASILRAVENTQLSIKLLWSGGPADTLASLLSRFNPVVVCCPPGISFHECAALSKTPAIALFSTGRESGQRPNTKCAREAVDLGAAIALSTGYDFRNALTFNMQTALAFAVLRLQLTPEEAITSATINAACAVGCGTSTGSIEVGKQADLLVLDLADYRELPRQFGVNHVYRAMRAGTFVSNGASLTAGTQ